MDQKFYQEYYKLEREGWWFKARLSILENYCQAIITNPDMKILNVGAATGATSEMLSKYGKVTSLEYDEFCCKFLKEKTGIEAINASLTELPFENNSYDMICAFDVIEHIENDNKAVEEIYRVLKPKGKYFITVPAFQSLWSNHDVVNHHFRRYKKKQLNKLIESTNLKIDHSTYFNFWLFIPISITRFILNNIPRKKDSNLSGSDNEILQSSNIINRILYRIFHSEKFLLRINIKFPFGISILTIGYK
ncbi:MAG: class I SAM-dependent methyltransferase [Bacteroidia bacterium]|jgi:ubiquinone/menaquinone biosynthesis C-methylase UbiE|nr:class I SAM-dependent methyltransferase [Bacteroidia bacterium]|tara:strand:+ start:13352 stop:14098 length:747 start_codon:yes stop_codon:yes gene_type:complete